MKKLCFAIGLLLVCISPLSAQVAMRMQLNQNIFLQFESVYARITLRNMSAHALAFGEWKGLRGTIRFDINYVSGSGTSRIHPINPANMPSLVGVIIPPGSTHEVIFRISDYYDLRKTGNYTVKTVLFHPQLKSGYESNAASIKVVKGQNVWGPITVGIPDSGKGKADSYTGVKKIETRNYSIVSYYTGKVSLYALIIDDKDKTYLVKRIGFDLGPEMRPKCEIDFLSRLNLMIAASPTVFAYYQYNVDGILEQKQVYIKTGTTPTLVLDPKTGIVMPTGGRIARKDRDYEEIKDLPFMEDILGSRSRRRAVNALRDLVGGEEKQIPQGARDLPNPEFK